jgi:hypothetical protein
VIVSGCLADGTSFSQSANLSKDGRWPFYANPYTNNGAVFGWLTFTNGSNSITGSVNWIKKPQDVKSYPDGFTNTLSSIGSAYTSQNAELNLPAPEAFFSGGDLSKALPPNPVTLSANRSSINMVGTNGLTLTIDLSTGLLTGQFNNPASLKATAIKGILLPQENVAEGFFLTAHKSGALLLK